MLIVVLQQKRKHIMRRLINCSTCSPTDKSTRNIWDDNCGARTRTCRNCGTTVNLKALSATIVAKRTAHNAKLETLIAELLAR